MENENIIDYQQDSTDSLSINSASKAFLRETAGWAKFLAILGFVFTGLIALAGLFMGSIFAAMQQENPFGGFIGVVYVLIGLLYFFPALYLFKYSTKLKQALDRKDSQVLSDAFENEKSMFKFMGILMIILLGFYALAIIGGIGAAALFS